MPAKLPHYLIRSRHGIYYLRIVRDGRERRRSLRTRDPLEAEAAAYRFGATIRMMKNNKSFDPELLEIAEHVAIETRAEQLVQEKRIEEAARQLSGLDLIQPSSSPTPPNPISLKDGLAAWFTARQDGVTHNTLEAWSTYGKRLVIEFNGDTLAHTLTPGQFTSVLTKMKKTRSENTVAEYAYAWRLFFEWLVEHEHAIKNPIVIPKKSTRTAKARRADTPKDGREPWSAQDLDKIFNADRPKRIERPEMVWLPWIALFTGARRESLIHLKTTDFNEYSQGHWSVHFDERWDKTGRAREIPIPPALIELGLMDYIKDVRSLGLGDDLFPHVADAIRDRSHYFGNRFSEDKKRPGCSPNVDFHAFRTTLISVLAANSCAPIHFYWATAA